MTECYVNAEGYSFMAGGGQEIAKGKISLLEVFAIEGKVLVSRST